MPNAKRNMLSPEDGDRFYHLFLPLLVFVDQEGPIYVDETGTLADMEDMQRRARRIWRDPSLIDSYIQESDRRRGKEYFTEEDRQILRSWKRFRTGVFYLVSHEADGTLLVNKSKEVYQIKGLQSPMEELFPDPPIIVETTLLPWKDVLITDGLYVPLSIRKPDSVRGTLQVLCRRAMENGTVITSL